MSQKKRKFILKATLKNVGMQITTQHLKQSDVEVNEHIVLMAYV